MARLGLARRVKAWFFKEGLWMLRGILIGLGVAAMLLASAICYAMAKCASMDSDEGDEWR